MQGDMTQATYGGTLATARTLLKSGVGRFLDGCFWRTFNITATVYVANECMPQDLELGGRCQSPLAC